MPCDRFNDVNHKACNTIQVHGSRSSAGPSSHGAGAGLLASQFIMMEDTSDGGKLVTCAVCMAVFFAVNECIRKFKNNVSYIWKSPGILQIESATWHIFKLQNKWRICSETDLGFL